VHKDFLLVLKLLVALLVIADKETGAEGHPTKASTLADAANISESYAEAILRRMKAQGLVLSKKGPGGGYWRAPSVASMSVLDVAMAVYGEENAGRAFMITPMPFATSDVLGLMAGHRVENYYVSVVVPDMLKAASLWRLIDIVEETHLRQRQQRDTLLLKEASKTQEVVLKDYGKTNRLSREAIQFAKEGKTVFVIVATMFQVRPMQNNLRRLLDEAGEDTSVEIRVLSWSQVEINPALVMSGDPKTRVTLVDSALDIEMVMSKIKPQANVTLRETI
jgi:DNA-binding IscR family transcriptional regulator